MVILSPSTSVADLFETEVVEVEDAEKNDYIYVRPCERYKELYKSCKSFRSRFGQYYVYGEFLDCSDHWKNYKNCLQFRKTGNFKDLDSVVRWEKNMIETRVNTVLQNKAWEMRDKPPVFDAPLPEFIAKRQAGSLFAKFDQRNKD